MELKTKPKTFISLPKKKQILASCIISPISNANLGTQQRTMILISRDFFSPLANVRLVSSTLIRGTGSAGDIEREWMTISW